MSVAHRHLPVESPVGNDHCATVDAGYIGSSAAACQVRETIRQIAKSKATVFITGESGTGKEVCAEIIHAASDRAFHPFIAVNCVAIPVDLMESELFGHLKGSFAGTLSDRQSAALLVHRGTLFLDEICEMQLSLQTKLLRFLQTGLVQRVGSGQQEPVDIRVVCATNRNPQSAVAEGRFRKDLLYRLLVIPLYLPVLAGRGDDVNQLAEHFLALYSAEEQKIYSGFTPMVQARFRGYSWSGNVRELQNVIRRIVVLNSGPMVEEDMLPVEIRYPASAPGGNGLELASNVVPFGAAMSIATVKQATDRPRELWQIERDAIENAIVQCGGSIPQAVRLLGVSPLTIYRKKESWLTHA